SKITYEALTSTPDTIGTIVVNGGWRNIYRGKPKVLHTNKPWWPIVPPWRVSVQKLPMAVVQKSATPSCHRGDVASI
ncbi:hypothetical protein L195_g059103, partial [Trifolium pratense]